MIKVHLLLIEQEGIHVLHAEHFGQKRAPKDLAIAFLVAFTFPPLRKVARGFLLLYLGHSILNFLSISPDCQSGQWKKGNIFLPPSDSSRRIQRA